MKLVEFADGTFGVRLSWMFGWYFLDLDLPHHSWKRGSQFFEDSCKGSRIKAESRINRVDNSYKVVEVHNKRNETPPTSRPRTLMEELRKT
jgi:hypothetical protein